jgi:hypothetical protein
MGCDIITGGGLGLMQAASNVSPQISTAVPSPSMPLTSGR